MIFDFTTYRDRRGMDAMAVDQIPFDCSKIKAGFSLIPMWVADMNFATAPSVVAAVQKRLEHPLFGYFPASDEYYASIIRWQKTRNGANKLKKEHVGYENGVLGGVMSALNALCCSGDPVLLHSPTYIGFTSNILRGGYRIVHSPLEKDESGIWRMNFDDMDKKIRENHIHVAVFCSPHNPCGRVWQEWEIKKAMEVCEANNCFVISDEIWSDILLNGNKHIPTQSVSKYARDNTVALYAPSKTFNLAGMIGAYHIVYGQYLRDRLNAAASKSGYNHMNVLSMHALIGAYSAEGGQWADALCEVLSENINYAHEFIGKRFDGIETSKPEGTYMMYLDCKKWCEKSGADFEELLASGMQVGVIWQDGRPFLCPDSIRINLALPHEVMKEALNRLAQYVF